MGTINPSQIPRKSGFFGRERPRPAGRAIKRELKIPKYQMRVVEDKTKYKHKRNKVVRSEDFRKAA